MVRQPGEAPADRGDDIGHETRPLEAVSGFLLQPQFKAMAESARIGIVSASREGFLTYVNHAAQTMFGYGEDELLGQPITVLMPGRLRARHRVGWLRFIQTGEARVMGKRVELTGLRKDGTEFPIELALSTWDIGTGPNFTATIQDITDRLRT